MKKLTLKEKVDYMRLGLGFAGIGVSDKTSELIIRMYEGIQKKKGNFRLSDGTDIEVLITGKYTPKIVTLEKDTNQQIKELLEEVKKLREDLNNKDL